MINPGEIMVLYGHARKGFEYPLIKFAVITESDIFGQEQKKKKKKKVYNGKRIQDFAELSIGDYVVHEKHGLGIYRGIEKEMCIRDRYKCFLVIAFCAKFPVRGRVASGALYNRKGKYKMVKIDIISGFLGAGKTTLIKKLLKEAFEGEQVVLILSLIHI